ncbi:hypothetical protein BJ912DRAFT_943247 [Pholiota molesta]|nr:hypothetical protein BJ912DRAFT_943247 [Pholiota molesta]
MRGAFMLAFVVAPSSPTRPHSPSTHTISVAYATLCGVETRRARHCHTHKIHQAGMGSARVGKDGHAHGDLRAQWRRRAGGPRNIFHEDYIQTIYKTVYSITTV